MPSKTHKNIRGAKNSTGLETGQSETKWDRTELFGTIQSHTGTYWIKWDHKRTYGNILDYMGQ